MCDFDFKIQKKLNLIVCKYDWLCILNSTVLGQLFCNCAYLKDEQLLQQMA